MTATRLSSARHRPGRYLAAVAALVCAALTLSPGSAWAADTLTSAQPADRVALAAAPDAVVLTFSAVPDKDLSHVSTRDSAGRELDTGEAAATGRTGLRQAVSIRAAGDYTVAFHVVFDDGTELVGVLRFSVGTGVPPAVDAAAVQRAQRSVAGHAHSVDPLSGTLLVVDLVVFVAVVLLLMRRRVRPEGTEAA